jgi:TonB family protein
MSIRVGVHHGLLALTLASCRTTAPEQPVEGHLELCCKAADEDNISFVGCRTTGRCRTGESVWVRGPLTCSHEALARCEGGLCCTLDLEAVAMREGVAPRPPNDDHDDHDDHDHDPAPHSAPDSAPIALDWQARPTPVVVPKLVCPAAVERGITGLVELDVEVDASGRVTKVVIRQGFDPECDELARAALAHAEFEPALTPAGDPVAASLIWVYRFDVPEQPEAGERE